MYALANASRDKARRREEEDDPQEKRGRIDRDHTASDGVAVIASSSLHQDANSITTARKRSISIDHSSEMPYSSCRMQDKQPNCHYETQSHSRKKGDSSPYFVPDKKRTTYSRNKSENVGNKTLKQDVQGRIAPTQHRQRRPLTDESEGTEPLLERTRTGRISDNRVHLIPVEETESTNMYKQKPNNTLEEYAVPVPHQQATCPPGMVRRDPVSFSAIGMINDDTQEWQVPLQTRAHDLQPQIMERNLSKEPVAIAVMEEQEESDEENVKPVVATEKTTNRLSFENKRLWIGLVVTLLVFVCGAIAGTVVGLVSRDDTPPTSLPFNPTPPLPPTTPNPEPINYEFQQVGSSLFEETSAPANVTLGPRGQVYFGWAVDLSSDGQRLVVTSPYYSSAYIYDLQGTTWVKSAKITDIEGGYIDHIALSGSNVFAIGMPGNDDVYAFGGKVQVYEETSIGSWQRRGNPIFGRGVGYLIGGNIDSFEDYNGTNRTGDVEFSIDSLDSSSLAMSRNGQVLAIGSSASNTVQVFAYNDSDEQWALLKTFVGESAGDKFGASVDLSSDGQRIIIGAPNNIGMADPDFDIYNGHVRIFQHLQNDTWIQLGQDIDGSKGEQWAGEQSGSSVSISADGSIISVGATLEASSEDIYALGDNDGSVKVYRYDESKQDWRQLGNTINVFQFGLLETELDEITALVAGLGSEKFPIVARLSGDGKRVALSALAESLNYVRGRGVVRLYELRGEVWEMIAAPVEGTMPFDHSGRSIALSFDGSRVAIGSPEHNNDSPDDGQVRVFEVQESQGSTGVGATPTSTPAPTPTIASPDTSVPILVALNIDTYGEAESGWILECHGVLVANRTVIGSANVTETFLVEDGGVCQLVFSESWTIELYTVYYGENDVSSPVIISGELPGDRDNVVFHATPNVATVTVVIQPDLYIRETSWSLYCDKSLFMFVPLGEMYGSDTLVETIMGIKAGSLCQFKITDAFGDGICCDAGRGSYRLYFGDDTADPGALIAEGGNFKLEEEVDFVVESGPTTDPTTASPNMTSYPPNPNSPVTIYIHFDDYPYETGWSLYCDNALLASIPTGTYSSDLDVTQTFLIKDGAQCRFTITDSNADGLCCEYGTGYFRLLLGDNVNDGILYYEGGSFNQTEEVSFAIEDGQMKPV